MDQAATTSQPGTAVSPPPAQAGVSEPLDLAKLTAEIEALAQMASIAAAPQSAGSASDASALESAASQAPGMSGSSANDLSQIEREIEALLAGGTPSIAQSAAEVAAPSEFMPEQGNSGQRESTQPPSFDTVNAVDADGGEFEQLRAVLDESPSQPMSGAPAATTADLRRDAIVEPPSDPLLQEVDALLADDADSLLKASGEDIGRAVESVFDPRALSGQEEDVNRALIEAFGSTRSTAFSFGDAMVTNPAPRFAGVSKEVPPDMPRVDLERAARAAQPAKSFDEIAADSLAKKPAEYAGEKPFEPAFPPLPVATPDPRAAPAGTSAPAAQPVRAPEPQATPAPIAAPAVAPRPDAASKSPSAASNASAVTEPAPTRVSASMHASKVFARARVVMVAAACAPLAILAFPMRFVPSSARGFVSIAAVTTVLWVPVAWWYASAQAKKPGVGPVALVERAVEASAESEAAAESSAEPAEKPKDSAEKSAGSAAH